MSPSGLLRLLRIHFVSLFSKFGQNLYSSCRENAPKPLKKGLKMHENSPFLSQLFSLKMTSRQKSDQRIFRRFRISNQNLDSIFRSRDIRLSLDPVFAFFEPNLTFRDEYLENRIHPGGAVFAG